MWNIISSNRLVDQKIRKDNYRRHRLSLRKVKPQVDLSSPLEFQFLKTKPKPKQIARDLSLKIQTQNLDLLRKMICPQDQNQFNLQNTCLKDQNYGRTCRKISEQTTKGNKKFFRRLLQTPSCIDFSQLQKRNQQMDKIKANISRAKYVMLSYGKKDERTRPNSARL